MIKYHDEEWGMPVFDDRLLFAKLILDGAQAGLSWSTILNKRENYWSAFDDFDAEKIACYDEKKFTELMNNPGIVPGLFSSGENMVPSGDQTKLWRPRCYTVIYLKSKTIAVLKGSVISKA
ncbi:MAG: DNA-3-methyladenine glycosylase I, partial [Anaerolineales bacterium]|nr:DNA-3-methyladenine glycosylase I [Anaerolineales bacterium]